MVGYPPPPAPATAVTLPEFDIYKPEDRDRARRFLGEMDPDSLVIAFPCDPWSILQTFLNAPRSVLDTVGRSEEVLPSFGETSIL